MEALKIFVKYEVGFLITAFSSVIAYQLLTGRINMRGLLREKTAAGLGKVSPARVQLLLFTFAMAVYVLSEIVRSQNFPTIETKWLLILGGSHSIFLGAKGVLSLFTSGPQQP